MKTSTVVWIVAIAIVLGLGWYVYRSKSPDLAPSQNVAADDSRLSGAAAAPSGEESAPLSAAVVYGPNGFSPSTVTIAKGGAVTFKNEGAGKMWVAADLHPTHEEYDGTSKNQHCPDTVGTAFDQCSVGASYSFMFGKTGTWHYHNHVNASDTGTVIVR